MGVTRSVELRLSSSCRSALVLGFVHPMILLPVDHKQPPDLQALEQVIGIIGARPPARRWANLLQRVLEAVLIL